MWRAFYAPGARKEKQILPMTSVESVETIRAQTNRTNHRAERMAVIEGVKSMPADREVKIVAGSQYSSAVLNSNTPKPKNQALVLRQRTGLDRLKPRFQHAHGHSGRSENELVDKLASRAAQGTIDTSARQPGCSMRGLPHDRHQ